MAALPECFSFSHGIHVWLYAARYKSMHAQKRWCWFHKDKIQQSPTINGDRLTSTSTYSSPLFRSIDCFFEIAAASGREEVTKVLLEQEIIPGTYHGSTQRALNQAATNDHLGSFELLPGSIMIKGAFLLYFRQYLKNFQLSSQPSKALARLRQDMSVRSCEPCKSAVRVKKSISEGNSYHQGEKYKVLSFETDLLGEDFMQCCKFKRLAGLDDIFQCKH